LFLRIFKMYTTVKVRLNAFLNLVLAKCDQFRVSHGTSSFLSRSELGCIYEWCPCWHGAPIFRPYLLV